MIQKITLIVIPGSKATRESPVIQTRRTIETGDCTTCIPCGPRNDIEVHTWLPLFGSSCFDTRSAGGMTPPYNPHRWIVSEYIKSL